MVTWRVDTLWATGIAIPQSTRCSYEHTIHQFAEFWNNMGYKDPVDNLLHYGIFLKRKDLAVHLIKARFSALAFASKLLSWCEHTGDFRICKMLDGWMWDMVPSKDVSYSILFGSWLGNGVSDYEISLFHMASLVAFFGWVNWWHPPRRMFQEGRYCSRICSFYRTEPNSKLESQRPVSIKRDFCWVTVLLWHGAASTGQGLATWVFV